MQQIQRIAILGAGVMGQGIAQLCAQAGYPTWLYDIEAVAIERALEGIRAALEKRVSAGKLSHVEQTQTLRRLTMATDIEALRGADVVIEAVVEKLTVKHSLLKQLEDLCSPETIFASNTSSLSIAAIAAEAQRPERVAGLHFFNPAPVMKLVEVVAAPDTSQQVCAQLADFAITLGKIPVQVADSPGFIVNRCARPFYSEALTMLEQGLASVEVIDACLKSNAGVPLGPFELMDLVGLDINLSATETVWEAFNRHPRFAPSEAIRQRVAQGHLGRKTGEGFYRYPRAESSAFGPPKVVSSSALAENLTTVLGIPVVVSNGRTLAERLAEQSAICLDQNLVDWSVGRSTLAFSYQRLSSTQVDDAVRFAASQGVQLCPVNDTAGLIVQRMVSQLHREAQYLVAEGVAKADDVDTAMQKGLNFVLGPFVMYTKVGHTVLDAVNLTLRSTDSTGRYDTVCS